MKRLLSFALAALLAIAASAQSEFFAFTLNGGYTHTKEPHLSCAAFGGGVTFYDVYFGVLFHPASKATSLDVGKWGNQYQVYTYQLGYRIGLGSLDSYGITPIVGVTTGAVGYVDGNDWTYDDTYGVVNKFHATKQRTYVDAGVSFDYKAPTAGSFGIKLSLTATIHTLSVGIGMYMHTYNTYNAYKSKYTY